MTAGAWLEKALRYLESRQVPEPEANAEFLLAHVLKTGRNEARLAVARTLTDKQEHQFWHLVLQRGRRLPLAYVLGSQPFMGLEIAVNRGALVPRPETEEVVAEAVRLLRGKEQEALHLIELGTGTGCIAVALSVALPHATVWATDISPEALKLAEANATAHHRGRHIRFLREDLFKPESAPKGWADLVISNPPYIPTGELSKLEPEVLQEPRLALDGGKDGLQVVKAVIAGAPRWLKPGGHLVLEIGHDQGPAVLRLLALAGLQESRILKDAQGHDRIAVGRRG